METTEKLIERPFYFERLWAQVDVPVIKVLTGVRRCGKSTLLTQLATRLRAEKLVAKIVELNLESDDGLRIRRADDLADYLREAAPDKKERTYFFLDEVQHVPGWEDVVNALRVSWDADIYLTGSNSTVLSGDLATNLAGRYVSMRVRPFTFRESAELYREKGLSPDELFRLYLEFGGYPVLKFYDFDRENSLDYLRGVYDSAVRRDVVEHNAVRDVDAFDRVLSFAFGNIGHTFSANSISRFLKSAHRAVSVDTVLNYLRFIEEAFLVDRVARFDVRGKEVLRAGEKYYAADLGLRTMLGFSNSADIDQALENIVYSELVARGYEVYVGSVPQDGESAREVDFVARKDGQNSYYQVCYLLAGTETVEREFGALEAIGDNYPKFVLSMDPLDRSRNGIIHRNLVDWLMG
ncbi:MAG: ATP-binding protein [Mobiluncus porci]|uniref:ATP-binding protein n=1 Tax=Mobiluncus porci TaxID=2652278 RepID=UPI0023F1530D|nr:ATP-binding protein [Mobiluncus porci]MDD7540702.1 ATP-binding protein [Mobiluncus porci]MDY5748265.1 ATP-binding protein [Mobiluncus porci]